MSVSRAAATELPERERNRLLRRADWRFLLSRPRANRLLCLAGGELSRAAALVAGHVDDREMLGRGGVYDVAVAKDPDDAALAAVFEQLAPAGELYSEWTGSAADRGDVQRRLAHAGFSETTFYWPWPEPPLAEAWVPLDAPGTFDYYLGVDRHVYSGARHRLGTRVRRMLARARLVGGRAAPLCAVSRKEKTGGPSLDAGSSIVETAWRNAELGAPPAHLTCLLLTGGPRSISKVVGAVFAGGGARPALVVKWPRVEESGPGLLREADALEACHAGGRVGGRVGGAGARAHVDSAGVPRLLARTGEGATLAIAETAVAGVPMFTLLTRRTFAALARQGSRWLADFEAADRGELLSPALWTHRTTDAIDRFADTFGPVIDAGLVRETTALASALDSVASVIEHRDFGPWNILVGDAGELSVLDWESSQVRGLPMLDLIYFVTYMAFFLDGAMVSRRFAASYRKTLDVRSFTGAIRRELIEEHCLALAIPPATARALRALCWIGHAESEFQRFTVDAGGRPTADALGASVFVRLWEEEIRELCR